MSEATTDGLIVTTDPSRLDRGQADLRGPLLPGARRARDAAHRRDQPRRLQWRSRASNETTYHSRPALNAAQSAALVVLVLRPPVALIESTLDDADPARHLEGKGASGK